MKLLNHVLPFILKETVVAGKITFIQPVIFEDIQVNVTVDTKLFEL